MLNRLLFAVPVLLVILCTSAQAEINFGGGLENYRWAEEPDTGAPLTPKETGTRLAVNFNWAQDGERGVLFGYRGKLYFGQVHYDTYTQLTKTPVSTHTNYIGVTHEGQLLYRTDAAGAKLDYVGGLGYDSWLRSIDNNGFYQNESYSILFLRGGINLDQPMHQPGFHGGGGLKYPFWAAEDAHLKEQGYYSNPIITPGKAISLYAELGYRISDRWDVVGYYDSWRFKQSDTVYSVDASGTWAILQPKSSMDVFGIRAMYSFPSP